MTTSYDFWDWGEFYEGVEREVGRPLPKGTPTLRYVVTGDFDLPEWPSFEGFAAWLGFQFIPHWGKINLGSILVEMYILNKLKLAGPAAIAATTRFAIEREMDYVQMVVESESLSNVEKSIQLGTGTNVPYW